MIGELGDDSEPEHVGPELVHGWEYDPAEVTVRIQLEREAGSGSVAGEDIRFSLKAGYLGLKITKAYIGVNNGTDDSNIYDFTSPPVQVFFNDGAPGFEAQPDEIVFCDWINMPFAAHDRIVWSFYIAPGDPDTFRVYTNAGLGDWNASSKEGDFATVTDFTDYIGNVSHQIYFEDLFIGTLRGRTDANPAHMIYECLTNTDWGMGSPASAIDVDSFEGAALTLYNEDFGLSMIWTRQASIQDFIQEILDHIQAVLFVDPATGLLTLKLIRGDYDPDTLPIIDQSNATLSSFGRKLWGEIVNEVVVTWTNPENEQEETVVVQDLASIVTQGGIVSDGRNYYGVRSAALAQKLAQRDLRASGAPLASFEAEVDRSLWQVRPAAVYRVNWPEYGLSGVVVRVTDVNYGKPGDPAIKLTLVEDVFGLDVGDYIEPPGSIWEDPSSAPAPLEFVQILTLPYFMAAGTTVAAFSDSPEYPEVLAGVLGSTTGDDTFEYELWDEIAQPDSSLEWQSLQTENVIGRAELVTPFVAEAETEFDEATDLTTLIGQTVPTQGGFMLIGDGTEEENEIALITAVGETATISRGVLDTVPRAWPAGTPVWFVDSSTLFEDPVVRAAGEVVSYKMLTRTSNGLLALGSAPLVSYTLTERPWLPSRPANVEAHGEGWSTELSPIDARGRADPWVTVTWANRNRLTEDSVVLGWTDGDVTPETGQTTRIEVLAADGTPQATHAGLTGASFDVPDASFGSEEVVRLQVWADRTDDDGEFASLQAFELWVQVGGEVLLLSGDATDGDDAVLLSGDETGRIRISGA